MTINETDPLRAVLLKLQTNHGRPLAIVNARGTLTGTFSPSDAQYLFSSLSGSSLATVSEPRSRFSIPLSFESLLDRLVQPVKDYLETHNPSAMNASSCRY